MVRLKHRYVVCQLLPASYSETALTALRSVSSRDVVQTLRDTLQGLYGDMGAGEIGHSISMRYWDATRGTRIFVIRVPRGGETQTRFALSCMSSCTKGSKGGGDNIPLVIRTLALAGSSRTCVDKLRDLLRIAVSADQLDETLREMEAIDI
jgi:RNase P/RNase MRP subunit POP5